MPDPTIIWQGLATLQTLWIPIILLLGPVAYMTLSRWQKSWIPAKEEIVSSDYSLFDTANIRVTKIFIHPIKSCRGTSVPEARYSLEGLENDRRWCIIRAHNNAVVTARDVDKMVLINPRIIPEASSQEGGRLEVSFPKESRCEPFSIPLNPSETTLLNWQKLIDVSLWGKNNIEGYVCETSIGRSPSEILSEYVGFPVHLVMKGPRLRICPPTRRFPKLDAPTYFQDAYPLLVVSEESVAAIQEEIRGMVGLQGVAGKWSHDMLQVERFRPNIVIKGAGAPFVEDVLTEFTIDSANGRSSMIRLVSKSTRCVLPNIDPETGVRDKAVPLKVLMKHRRGLDPARPNLPCMGCNGVPSGDGVIKVGDGIMTGKMGCV